MLLRIIQQCVGCEYLSDLCYAPYNEQAKQIFKTMDLSNYSIREIADAIIYLFKAG